MSGLLDAAHDYAGKLGWAVLPCRGKMPAIPKSEHGAGWLDATRDHDEIDRLWHLHRPDSIGIACKTSGFMAVDVDPRDGGDDTLANIEANCGKLPHTVRQITGSGGEHILFRVPPAFEPAGSLGPGIQLKWRGYIIASPSLHVTTRRPYSWDVDCHPGDVEIAPAPEWLLQLAAPKKTAAGRTDWASIELETVSVGDRTTTLTRLCGLLLRQRVHPHVAGSLLWAWNLKCCNPPLARKKFNDTMNGIAARESARRQGGTR